MPELEWFTRLGDVPGISWEPPVDVKIHPSWAAARPVLKTFGDDDRLFTLVSWRDLQGRPFDDEFTYGSPAEAAGRSIRESGTAVEALTALSRSLSLPGTRRDAPEPAKVLQIDSGRYRVRTSDLLLVRDAQAGEGKTRAATSDVDLGCKQDAFVEWLSAGGGGVWTA